MNQDLQPDKLTNQSLLQYSYEGTEYQIYSNQVETTILSPIIKLAKTAVPMQITPGLPVTYTITITNTGNTPAAVTLFDAPSGGLEFMPNSVLINGIPKPGIDPRNGIPLGQLDAASKVIVSFQLRLPYERVTEATGSSEIPNQARADYKFQVDGQRFAAGTSYSNIVRLPLVLPEGPNLTITLSVNKSRAVPGDVLQYTFLMDNKSRYTLDVQLMAGLPKGTLYIPNTLVIQGRLQTGVVPSSPIHVGSIPPHSKLAVTYSVRVGGETIVHPGQWFRLSGIAQVYYLDAQGNRQECTATSNEVHTQVIYPLLEAKAEVKPKLVQPGETVLFTLVLTNSGILPAKVFLERIFVGPLLLKPQSLILDGSSIPDPGPPGILELGSLSPGGAMELILEALISPFVISPLIKGVFHILYTYEVNGTTYRGEVRSNSYTLLIESDDE